MILPRLKDAARDGLLAWSREEGLESPPPVSFAPAPAHVAESDIAVAWPMAAAKALRRRPLDIAAAVSGRFAGFQAAAGLPETDSAAHASPPGFLNLRLGPRTLAWNLLSLLRAPEDYGRFAPAEPRDILLEFVSANPTGPVHLASSRAATLGDSLARILRRLGHRVRTEYYVNDAGRQVKLLGLSVQARWDQAHGKDTPLPEDGYRGDYIADIAKSAPPEAAGWTSGDFQRFAVEAMLAQHKTDMERFGVRFDRWFRESELHDRRALDKTLARLRELGRVYDKDDAVWLGSSGEGSEDDKDRVLVRRDGLPTYFLADIAYHQDKLERGARELIDIWGADHHGYVPRMKEAIAALGCPKGTFHAIIHQLVHLFRGTEAVRMSKRAGEFITLRDLVDEVGVDACRFFFAMRTPNAHMNFDLELAKKQSNENPVFYAQYVHARIASIFREAAAQGLSGNASSEELAALQEPAERGLLVKLVWFPEVLLLCERDLSPGALPTYLLELGALYHKFYELCRVLDPGDPARTRARLTLCAGVQAVIRSGLDLLGVSSPEQM